MSNSGKKSGLSTYNRIMEVFWLSMGAVLTVIVLYMLIADGWDKNVIYLVFPGICFMMYFARRFMRKRMEKHQKWLEENANKNSDTH